MTPGFINLLGDGVENVLLGEAFRLAAKLTRFPEPPKSYNICLPGQMFLPNHMYGYSQGFIPLGPPPIPVGIPMHYQFSPASDSRQQ